MIKKLYPKRKHLAQYSARMDGFSRHLEPRGGEHGGRGRRWAEPHASSPPSALTPPPPEVRLRTSTPPDSRGNWALETRLIKSPGDPAGEPGLELIYVSDSGLVRFP